MPNYSRIPGTNIAGLTVIRLIPVSTSLNMDTVQTFEHLYKDEVWSVFNDAPVDGVYTFPTLNNTGKLAFEIVATEAGDAYQYEVSWRYPRNQLAQTEFHKLITQKYFILAVADGNGTFMVLGTPAQPFEVTGALTDAADYAYAATAMSTNPPLYVEGITNNFLYYGDNTIN